MFTIYIRLTSLDNGNYNFGICEKEDYIYPMQWKHIHELNDIT